MSGAIIPNVRGRRTRAKAAEGLTASEDGRGPPAPNILTRAGPAIAISGGLAHDARFRMVTNLADVKGEDPVCGEESHPN